MPHDVNGKPLREGDEVVVRCKVSKIFPQDDFCNVALEAVVPMDGGGGAPSILHLNAGQTERVGGNEEAAPPAPPKSISA